ncbi:MAG TPA: beta-galactosidase [Candidatus Hydrogenedentes bacterium]|nr:beta-galactosidase [Candidatus Hydrogenedentota bacterium]HNT87331.1 beta-galactosidase [Candidatus Hydrogenedentota bacterium]
MRSGTLGAPAIVVDGQVCAPIFFTANNQFGRDDILLQELRLAAEAGIPFFSFNLPSPWHASEDEIRRTIDAFAEAHPEGWFYPRVWVGASSDWLRDHPEERIAFADGERLDMASPSSAIWRNDAATQLRRCIDIILAGPHAKRFIGLMVTYLQTGEWFFPRTDEYMDYSTPNTAAFRDWLRRRYRRVAALREAWGDPNIAFETAEPPGPEEREATAWGLFRDPRRHRLAMDFHRFQSEMIAETIDFFGRVVKEATRGRALVGAFYGYTFELNHNGPRALAHSGHLALGQLLKSENIDLIHAPYAYLERALGEPGHFHLPVDSVALHGKLAIIEDDTFTHLSMPVPEGAIAPGWEGRTRSLEETLAITRRNCGNFLMHRCGFWFFDLLSDGRWNSRDFWRGAGLTRRIAAELRGMPPFQPEIAFVTDEETVAFLADTTHPLLLHSLAYQRHELARLGAPVGYYLAADLSRLPPSVRLLILPNAYEVSKQTHRVVDAVLARGGVVLWVYAPDLVGPEGPDVSRISALTGFDVEARLEPAALCLQHTNSDKQIQFDANLAIQRLIIAGSPEDGVAMYCDSQEVALATRRAGAGRVAYCAAPRVPLPLLEHLAREAGVHLYRQPAGHVAVVGPYLFAHEAHGEAESITFSWAADLKTVVRLVPPARLPVAVFGGRQWSDRPVWGGTSVYVCE